jgi:hypothetical protein
MSSLVKENKRISVLNDQLRQLQRGGMVVVS